MIYPKNSRGQTFSGWLESNRTLITKGTSEMEFNTSERQINKEIVEILKPSLLEDPFKGTIKEGCECKYAIINLKDLEKYIGIGAKQDLSVILDHVQGNIEHGREQDGKKPFNNYVVVNIDEPYINDIVAVLEANGHWDGKPSRKMRFFEINEPYYALIKAPSYEEAVQEYLDVVAGEQDEFDELMEEAKEVPEYYAAAKYSRGKGEDRDLIDIEEVLEDLKSNKTQILLMDGSLI